MRLLQVDNITAGYGDVPILTDVSIGVEERETVAVIGPNGAGKSTLLKCIAGLVPVSSGTIRIAGADCTHLVPEARPRLRMTYVPQSSNVFYSLSVRENLQVAMPRFTPKRDFETRIDEVVATFPELAGLLSKEAVFLSGGQRQITAVCAALMRKPRLMLMDEPSAGLSPLLVQRMLEHIVRIRDLGIAVLLVEQNARQALKISNRGYVLDSGRNVITGVGADLLNDERTIELYVGKRR
ncbi:MAG: ABC transporter ATP-binding protein [Rhizobiales bacterium]|nr:ABC transporter ATP-binding protein [Hyphomicrobiales bacterium]